MKNMSVILLLLLLSGCNLKENKYPEETLNDSVTQLMFEVNEAIPILKHPSFLKSKELIDLDNSTDALLDGYPFLLTDKESIFIYSPFSKFEIRKFRTDGSYIGKIGSIGEGPNEYTGYQDVLLDNTNEIIYIFTPTYIASFDYEGNHLEKIPIDLPALSFALDEKGNFWFYTGNNSVYSPWKLHKYNFSTNRNEKYLYQKSSLLPLQEINFSKSGFQTFRESFSNQLYLIKEDTIIHTYTIDFNKKNLPGNIHTENAMEIIEYLNQNDHCIINCFLENNDYIYLLIKENISGEELPHIYYQIFNKKNRKEYIFKINNDISVDSYLFNPQLLDDNNNLYLLGYIIEDNITFSDPDQNPSVVKINLDIALQ